jgi:UDP-N-acetylmuramate--alanine ligase
MIEGRFKYVFFIGIGGIGMSALARFFLARGQKVGGYDRQKSEITEALESEGASVIYQDEVSSLESIFREDYGVEDILVIYTPAVPSDSSLLHYFKSKEIKLYKRAEVLGLISQDMFTIGVAGTHGKTTTTTLLTHLLIHAGYSLTSFLGGIAGNYGTNYLDVREGEKLSDASGKSLFIAEADEYDRSFLQLKPSATILTSIDPDHLDIYQSEQAVKDSYYAYLELVSEEGPIVIKQGLKEHFPLSGPDRIHTYGFNQSADYCAYNIRYQEGFQVFDLILRGKTFSDFRLSMPGKHNVENALAVIALCHALGIGPDVLKPGLENFRGVKRRFEIRYQAEGRTIIDDYAHHPTEIKAAIESARLMFPDKRITAIFQPHLFSRTQDFCEEFAHSLSLADRVLLLDIYPARELPIPGVSSRIILEKLNQNNSEIIDRSSFLDFRDEWMQADVFLVMGAGDIDQNIKTIISGIGGTHHED